MAFMGHQFGKLDGKGRVSIPAPFRSVLEKKGSEEVVFLISQDFPCIEIRARPDYDGIVESIGRMNLYSEQRMDMEAAMIAGAVPLRYDSEGRLSVPPDMIEELGLKHGIQVAFLGKGDRFELWEEALGRAHMAEAKQRVRAKRYELAPRDPTPRGVA